MACLPRCCVAFAFLALLSGPTWAQEMLGAPLAGLERLKDFQSRRISSSDPEWRNGNNDRLPIPPGQTVVLGEMEGPGVLTHIWCTIAHEDPHYSQMMTLRIYWDGEEHPSVEAPLGDFFGIGHGLDRSFTSIPIRVTSEGRARNCYWPMPFRKSARVTVTNDSDKPCQSFYYYLDWQQHRSLPADAAYFHAMYRQEFPCVMGRNYLLADIEGRGHYVGTIQSVYHTSPGWYGEGDDFFFIDGEQEPSLRGTGTEDYFCNAWGFEQQAGPFYGTPLWEGYNTGDRGSAYRFHLADPVVFTKSLRAEIEHKGSQKFPDGKEDGFIERDDLMSSVALWYQTEPHKRWAAMPSGKQRQPFEDAALVVGWKAVPQSQHSEHPIEVQPLAGVTDGKQLFFRPGDAQGWVEIPFTLAEPFQGTLLAQLVHSWDYGIYRVRLDGQELARLDLYAPTVVPSAHSLGCQRLAAGPHTLRFECVGKSDSSKGYFLGFEALGTRKAAYSRDPSVDLRSLQKAD